MNTLFTPDKPFKAYQEMVAYLQDFHHLACLDPAWDASVLQLVPYYDLIICREHNAKSPSSISSYRVGCNFANARKIAERSVLWMI